MKRILTLSSFLFLTIAFGFNEDIIQHQENDVLIINQEKKMNEKELVHSYEYLMSYDKAELFDDENMVLYSGRKLVHNNEIEYYQFEITYIKLIDIMFIDYSYLDEQCNIISNIFHTYAYPFINENDELDIKLDMYGQIYYLSNILNSKKENRPSIKKHKEYGPLPPLYDVLSISSCIASFDDAVGLAYSLVDIPDIVSEGPLAYLFYQAKYEIAHSDFLNNISKNQPTGFIHNQNNDTYCHFEEWRFGIDVGEYNANIKDAGCESIAIYNMLYSCMLEQENNPHLPSIIALTQLCNADLFLGAFGTLTLPSEIINMIQAAIQLMYSNFIKPLLESLIPALAATILATYVGVTGWVDLFLPGLSEIVLSTIVASLMTSVSVAAPFFDWIVANQHGMGDVIGLLIGNHTYNSHTTLSSFSNDLSSKMQGIISYWNYMNADGTINYTGGGLHIVYVLKRQIINDYVFYNHFDYVTYSNGPNYYSSVSLGLERGYTNNIGYASTLFFSGFVMVQ